MNKRLFALGLSILCLLSWPVMPVAWANQPDNLQPGAAAPELGLEKILQAPAGARADGASLRGKVVMAAAAAELGQLVRAIEGVLRAPVIDETNLRGKFDWELLYDEDHPKSIIEAVRKEFGLELTLAKRSVEMIVIEKQ